MNWFLCLLVGDYIVGAVVLASIDDKKQSLFRWYDNCPEHIAWFVQPLVLLLWPVVVWAWQRRNT